MQPAAQQQRDDGVGAGARGARAGCFGLSSNHAVLMISILTLLSAGDIMRTSPTLTSLYVEPITGMNQHQQISPRDTPRNDITVGSILYYDHNNQTSFRSVDDESSIIASWNDDAETNNDERGKTHIGKHATAKASWSRINHTANDDDHHLPRTGTDKKSKASFVQKTHPRLLELLERSMNLMDESSSYGNMKVAVCHKTIFGDVDIWTFIDWIVYNRMLGFDHFFFSFLPEIRSRDGFDVLVNLPYVTASENTRGYIERVGRDPEEDAKGEKLTQVELEKRCLRVEARKYDWVMIADADEYLWFNRTVGVKEFLHEMDQHGYDYLSLGKWFYSIIYRYQQQHDNFKRRKRHDHSGFYLADYSYTAGPYCKFPYGVTNETCSLGVGRAKIITKPSKRRKVMVHGDHKPERRNASLQVPSAWAHFKEWSGINMQQLAPHSDRVMLNVSSFWASSRAESGGVYNFRFYMDEEGNPAAVFHDANLTNWFHYIAQRRK